MSQPSVKLNYQSHADTMEQVNRLPDATATWIAVAIAACGFLIAAGIVLALALL